jgi:hypothetical protein
MEEFKKEFISVAYSEFGIKAIESINFEQAFAILDKMQALRIHDVVGRSEQLKPLPPNECDMCGALIDPRLTNCGGCGL